MHFFGVQWSYSTVAGTYTVTIIVLAIARMPSVAGLWYMHKALAGYFHSLCLRGGSVVLVSSIGGYVPFSVSVTHELYALCSFTWASDN